MLEAAKVKLKTSSLEAQKKKEKLGQSSLREVAKSSAPPMSKVDPIATKPELEAAGTLAGMKVKNSARKSRIAKAVNEDDDALLDVDLSLVPSLVPEASAPPKEAHTEVPTPLCALRPTLGRK